MEIMEMTLEEKIAGMLRDMGSRDLVFMWNEYCNSNNYADDYIFFMEEFDEMFRDCTPSKIAELVSGDGFNLNDKYYQERIYGLTSCDDPEYAGMIDVDDLAAWIVRTGNPLNNDEIREALEESDDEEGEE